MSKETTKSTVAENTEAEQTEAEQTEAEQEKLFDIRIPMTKEMQADVFVRCNQRTWLIKRGEWVKVPACVVEILNNSEDMLNESIDFQLRHQK